MASSIKKLPLRKDEVKSAPVVYVVEEKEEKVEAVDTARLVSPPRATSLTAVGKPKVSSARPPCINLTPTFSHTYRFYTSASVTASITVAQMFGALGGVCTVANTTVSSFVSSFRIKHIDVYQPAAGASSTPTMTYIEWYKTVGDYAFPDRTESLASLGGITTGNKMRFVPPKWSFAGDWVNTTIAGGTYLFNALFTIGYLLDMEVEMTLAIAESTSTVLTQSTITVGTLGNVYYLPLDGVASNKIRAATGVPTTT